MSSLGQIERNTPYGSVVDRELLSNVQKGDEFAVERLITKYEKIVQKKANTYFLVGSERDDVVQEGLIGLYKAICDYDENKRSSFKSFAELCITRQIISSIKSATRQKHGPLNMYISIYKPVQDDEPERLLLETIQNGDEVGPLAQMEKKEYFAFIQSKLMKTLTKLEWDVLYFYLQGWTYVEIATHVSRSEKAIDNALQRIKKKVEILIRENDF